MIDLAELNRIINGYTEDRVPAGNPRPVHLGQRRRRCRPLPGRRALPPTRPARNHGSSDCGTSAPRQSCGSASTSCAARWAPICAMSASGDMRANGAAGERIADPGSRRARPPGRAGHRPRLLADRRRDRRAHALRPGRPFRQRRGRYPTLPRYRAARDAALAAAEPFSSYWARHPQYHQANRAA